MKTVETENEKELLTTLENMVNQACVSPIDNLLDSMELTAYSDGMRLLAEYDRIKITKELGRRVIGMWVK